jgi:hypothetical protein
MSIALVEQRDDHLGQLRPDPGDALGVAVGQAHHRAPDHIGGSRVALGDAVVEHQALVEARATASTSVTVRSLPLSTIFIDCSPIYN